MGFKKEDLQKAEHPLYGFGNKRIEALGKIDVNMTFGQDAMMRTEVITFDVIDFVYPYNANFRVEYDQQVRSRYSPGLSADEDTNRDRSHFGVWQSGGGSKG
jgi:hypothetical protein